MKKSKLNPIRMLQWLYNGAERYWREYTAPPHIYVYQMGKVGSLSIFKTIEKYRPKGIAVHAHRVSMLTDVIQYALKFRLRARLPVYVICPIRAPLDRNVSAFFQSFDEFTGAPVSAKDWTAEELRKLFLEHYRHNVCLEWFELHFRPLFGIDVYATEFPKDRKWCTYEHGAVKALVYRADLPKEEQVRVVSKFLSLKMDEMVVANESSNKEYSRLYAEFCQKISLPKYYRRIMTASHFCRHFWTEEEARSMDEKWARGGDDATVATPEQMNALAGKAPIIQTMPAQDFRNKNAKTQNQPPPGTQIFPWSLRID